MKRLLTAAGLLTLAIVLVACGGATAASTAAPSVDPGALHISAKDIKFSTDKLEAKADTAFQIAFDNQEGAPHNVAIYTDESASQKVLVEEPFGGPKQVVYQVPALKAGSYFFRCDIHPNMKGTLEVSG
jgi:plastocyanin